eukprot:scaffold145049_cov220-Phaeocystis_antarctica.AAC.1
MPTYRELTSTNADCNVVPQVRVINSARKGKPSPSAGGGEHTSSECTSSEGPKKPAAPVTVQTESEPEPKSTPRAMEP